MTVQDGIKRWLRAQPWMKPVRIANLKRRQRQGLLPDWRDILSRDWNAWLAALAKAQGNPDAPRVLIATSTGIHAGAVAFDSYLAVALTLRGARCDVLLCDRVLPACMVADYTWYPRLATFAENGPQGDLCSACFDPGAKVFGSEGLGLPLLRYSEFLSEADRRAAHATAVETPTAEIPAVEDGGLPIGEHAEAGALRFFARGELGPLTQDKQRIAGRYLEAAALATAVFRRLLADRRYDVVIGHHGIYVPQGLAALTTGAAGTRFVAWNAAYRRDSFILQHGETYHRGMLSEPASTWADRPLSDRERRELMEYLATRATGADDWISFHRAGEGGRADPVAAIGLDPRKPLVTLLTSVIWDAQLHYRQRAFASQVAWVLETIHWFAGRPDLQLAIRVHPAEVTGHLPARQRIRDEIAAAFATLPPNVALVDSEAPVSTYALAAASNAAIIYATKTGIELAANGIPVIVAGESWLRGKGIGIDCSDPAEYRAALAALPLAGRMDAVSTDRAQRYAWHFFFRRMIPLPGFRPARFPGVPYEVHPSSLTELAPGASPELDLVCDGILSGSPFIASREAVAA